MAGLGTQFVIERAKLVTPRLRVRAPRFYPNNLHVRIWRGPRLGNRPGLLYSCVFRPTDTAHSDNQAPAGIGGPFRGRLSGLPLVEVEDPAQSLRSTSVPGVAIIRVGRSQ